MTLLMKNYDLEPGPRDPDKAHDIDSFWTNRIFVEVDFGLYRGGSPLADVCLRRWCLLNIGPKSHDVTGRDGFLWNFMGGSYFFARRDHAALFILTWKGATKEILEYDKHQAAIQI